MISSSGIEPKVCHSTTHSYFKMIQHNCAQIGCHKVKCKYGDMSTGRRAIDKEKQRNKEMYHNLCNIFDNEIELALKYVFKHL